jgi:TetR/AcrR family transcriptional repressor of nem operon
MEIKPLKKGELTRQMIVAKAAPIFNQRGYAGCSLNDILEATGLEKGGLYRHFASKEKLALEAFRYALANAAKLRTENLEHVKGTAEQLRYIVRRFIEVRSAIPGGCPLMNTAIDADDGNPELRRAVRSAILDWRKRLCKIVEDGIRNGEIETKTEPRQVANSLIAALEGALMISRIEGNSSALEDIGKTLDALLDQIQIH